MNKEQYVSFEVSKLLKEKGFSIPSDTSYEDYLWQMYDEDGKVQWGIYNSDWYFRITQQMACRWLREEKGIFVDIRVYSGLPVQFGYDISVLYPDKTLVDKGGTFGFSSYEEATEKGIKYVLQNLSKYL